MSYTILIGLPSSGMISEGSAKASWLATLDHRAERLSSCNSGGNYNNLWCSALNLGMQGKITHFAMLHADLTVVEETPDKRWLDLLIEEMDRLNADFISTPMAIKSLHGLTSSGIGNPDNPWNPWRRFCVNEYAKLPPTFSAEMIGYGDKYLLHNHALCVWDMRKGLWYETDKKGCVRALFNFTEKIELTPSGEWQLFLDSEDWAFSRQLWQIGARTYISSKIKTRHNGSLDFENYGEGGIWRCDEATSSQWRDTDPFPKLFGLPKRVAATVRKQEPALV